MRLLLISHAAPNGAPRLLGGDGPLSDGARARATQLGALLPAARAAYTSPARCARETAEAMGMAARPVTELADWELGSLAGLTLGELERLRPPGPVDELLGRVATWLRGHEGAPGTRAAVTHVAFVRAAVLHVLGAPSSSFWAIEVAPCSVTELRFRDARWHLAHVAWEPALIHVPLRRSRRRPNPKENQ